MQQHMFTEWLIRRKITSKVLMDFSLSVSNHVKLGECIVIPVYDENGVFSFNKYRRNPFSTIKPKYVYDAGGVATLYAWHKAKQYDTILITEGELDALVAWSHNIPAVSSTGGAGTFKKEWVDLLQDKKVILCFDNDDAGALGMVKIIKQMPHAQVILLPDAPHIKDISDYMQYGGDLNALMNTARSFDDTSIIEDRERRIALFKSTYFHDAWIDEINKSINDNYTQHEHVAAQNSNNEIERAKTYPIPKLLKFSRNKTPCLWHSEKTASMHYYRVSNSLYCFGCSKYADVIDVYRKLNDCSFKEAIAFLSTI